MKNHCVRSQPVLFLDFDDVLCLNKPYGGYDVIQALAQVVKKTAVLQDFKEVWEQLSAHDAKAHLQALHDEFSPRYVLSTSWRNFIKREACSAKKKSSDALAKILIVKRDVPNGPT